LAQMEHSQALLDSSILMGTIKAITIISGGTRTIDCMVEDRNFRTATFMEDCFKEEFTLLKVTMVSSKKLT